MDCIFCKIANGEIPSTKVYEDETVYCFKDIAPITPIHYLIIPKAHISGASAITADNSAVVAHIFEVAAEIAKNEGISPEVPMRQFEIHVSSVKDILDFVSIATKRTFPITVGNEKHRVNGKSFMEMFCLNFTHPLFAVVDCSDEEFQQLQIEMLLFLA